VSAGRLFEIARVLSVPVGYFYDGIGEEGKVRAEPSSRVGVRRCSMTRSRVASEIAVLAFTLRSS
jgi:hypothetical protein